MEIINDMPKPVFETENFFVMFDRLDSKYDVFRRKANGFTLISSYDSKKPAKIECKAHQKRLNEGVR